MNGMSPTVAAMYAEATAILRRCDHKSNAPCEVSMGHGETLWVCCDCYNKQVYAYRAARKAQMAEFKATLPVCDRCGKKAGNWTLGGWSLCGHCKTLTEREHAKSAANAGSMAIFITRPLVDTSSWAYQNSGTKDK